MGKVMDKRLDRERHNRRDKNKRSKTFFIITMGVTLLLGYFVIQLILSMNGGLDNPTTNFKQMALKMSAIRAFIVVSLMFFGWKLITKIVKHYFEIDITAIKNRVLVWYICIETTVVASLFWT